MKKLHVINIRVDGETKEKLQEMAAADHRSVSDFIRLQLERLSQISQALPVSSEIHLTIPSIAKDHADAVIKTFWTERADELTQAIAAIKAEKIPAERNSSEIGRKSWKQDQQKRIAQLEKQLQELNNKNT